jgi:hypothetical protein
MKQRFGVCATIVLTGILALPKSVQAQVQAQPEGEPTGGLRLSVQIYNWANVAPAILQKGQGLASRVFKEAGVELNWEHCPCETRSEPKTLAVRIIPKLFGSTRSTFRSDHLAATGEDGGVLASVFYDRIESLGKGGDLSELLGLATAHELGHLLLGSKAHTDEGIMLPRWTRKHLRSADWNRFRFTSEQSAAIRGRVTEYQATMNETR